MAWCEFHKEGDNCRCVRCGFLAIDQSECDRTWRHCDVPDDVSTTNYFRRDMAEAGAEKLGVTWKDAMHYAQALARWAVAGFPTRSDEEVERILQKCCLPCDAYTNGRCGKCGCRVNNSVALVNKIKMATENCPLGKW